MQFSLVMFVSGQQSSSGPASGKYCVCDWLGSSLAKEAPSKCSWRSWTRFKADDCPPFFFDSRARLHQVQCILHHLFPLLFILQLYKVFHICCNHMIGFICVYSFAGLCLTLCVEQMLTSGKDVSCYLCYCLLKCLHCFNLYIKYIINLWRCMDYGELEIIYTWLLLILYYM